MMPAESENKTYKIGILEIQGAFLEHKISLLAAAKEFSNGIQIDVTDVRNASHITSDIDGLIIPGGESTTMSLFLKRNNMEEALRDWVQDRNHVTWGTCAGMILLSKHAEHQKQGGQTSLDALDVVVSRNYFGRQVDSFEADLNVLDPELATSTPKLDSFHGVFIRAPAIVHLNDPDIRVLSTITRDEETVIVACQKDNVLTTSFHPELTEDSRWHQYFLRMVQKWSKGSIQN